MKHYGQYGRTAIEAARYARNTTLHPRESWNRAAARLTGSPSSKNHPSPRFAFLGLCQGGLIRGVPAHAYIRLVDNAACAMCAVGLLREDPQLAALKTTRLWDIVRQRMPGRLYPKNQGQMNVVLALWHSGLIAAK